MQCELCGEETELVNALVEGTLVNACRACAGFGKIVHKPKLKKKASPKIVEEDNDFLVSNYDELIRIARQKKGLSQEELAVKIGEKVSQIKKFESKSQEPNFIVAKKLNKELGISLIEKKDFEKENFKTKNDGPLTLGDIINLKK